MKARIILMEEPTPGEPIVAELDGVECPSGEKLEIAGLAPMSALTVAHHLGRDAPGGYPVVLYTRNPE